MIAERASARASKKFILGHRHTIASNMGKMAIKLMKTATNEQRCKLLLPTEEVFCVIFGFFSCIRCPLCLWVIFVHAKRTITLNPFSTTNKTKKKSFFNIAKCKANLVSIRDGYQMPSCIVLIGLCE